MPNSLKRRGFLRQAGAFGSLAAFPSIIPGSVFGQGAPSKTITLGFIGMGLQGIGRNLGTFLNQSDARVLAVCDVRKSAATKAKGIVDQRSGNHDCAVYQDFRDVIARQDLDAIVISTPDHWHVPISMAALQAGKDVFCEKPTLTISEGRKLANLVAAKNAVFQWGIEDRHLIKYHRLAGWARSGAIGKLESIHVSLPGKPPHLREQPAPVPEDLDWNLWLGPAPFHPYTPMRSDPQVWRGIVDYSGGSLTDWGAHLVDTAQVGAGMEQSGPVEVSGTTGSIDPDKYQSNTPIGYKLHYRYRNGTDLFVGDGAVDIKFVGADGWVRCSGWNGKWTASSDKILRIDEFGEDADYWPRPPIEHRDFLDSIHTRKPPAYPAEAGHRLSTTLHLGHLALRTGKTIRWNPDTEAFGADNNELKQSIVHQRPARNWETS